MVVELKSFDYTWKSLPKFRSRVTPEIVDKVKRLVEGQDRPGRGLFRSDADYVLSMLRPKLAALCIAFYHTPTEMCVPLGRHLDEETLKELDTTLVAEILDLV